LKRIGAGGALWGRDGWGYVRDGAFFFRGFVKDREVTEGGKNEDA